MGSDISKAANLDDLTDPKGGIDLGLEDAGLGGGIGAIEAGAGAGAAVGILDGTAGEAYDWIRGRSDEVDLGPYDPSSFDPSTYRGGGGYAPDLDYSDVFSEAATDAEDETEEEDEDEPEDEPEEEDEDEEPQPRPDPRPIPSAGDPEEKKEIPDKPETKHVTFKAKPIGASLLRAMKRLPSQDLNVDDIETKEESKADKETINIIQDDLKQGIWYDIEDNKLDHQNFHEERLRIDSMFLDRKFIEAIDESFAKDNSKKSILDSSQQVPVQMPVYVNNFTWDHVQPWVRQTFDQQDFRNTFTPVRESNVSFAY